MASEPHLVSVARIWDRAPHSAFTDLLRHHGRWWCTFREATDHGKSIGTLRVLVSDDGEAWTSAAEVVEEGIDLRDPKLSVMPDGRMLLLAGGTVFRGTTYLSRSPRVCFSEDGITWSAPARVLAEDHWLWRVTWHDGVGYSVSKLGEADNPRRGFLYTTRDGLEWQWVTELRPPDGSWTVSETTLRIMPDGEMIALIRPDWIGSSRPPYTEWSFAHLPQSLGGPNFIRVPSGDLWAGARCTDATGAPVTTLARMSRDGFDVALVLPSGGDNSYPGMVWHEERLWISYYSSHEGKANIYIAQVSLG
ncbi:MAG: sialidase family protein [Spirochaetaceae bacterium]|nr:sialidase family protein [Spirochaetaceae bacterium]